MIDKNHMIFVKIKPIELMVYFESKILFKLSFFVTKKT